MMNYNNQNSSYTVNCRVFFMGVLPFIEDVRLPVGQNTNRLW
jgi:hypothetical protein